MVSDSATNKRQSRKTTSKSSKSKSASKPQEQQNAKEVDLGLGLGLGLGLEPNQETVAASKEDLDRMFLEQLKQKAFVSSDPRSATDQSRYAGQTDRAGYAGHADHAGPDGYIGPDDYMPMDEMAVPDYAYGSYPAEDEAYSSFADGGMPATRLPSSLEQSFNEHSERAMAAVADVMATYKQHYEQLNSFMAADLTSAEPAESAGPMGAMGQVPADQLLAKREVQAGMGAAMIAATSDGAKAQGAKGAKRTEARAEAGAVAHEASGVAGETDSASGVRNLGIKRDWAHESRDLIRSYLVMRPYKSEELYADSYYFESVCNWEQQANARMKSLFNKARDSWGETSVLESADECSTYVSRISVAYIKYLEQHFPLGNKEDQEQFNVLLLVLFEKMNKGDVCINLSSLDSVYGVIAQWEKDSQSSHFQYETEETSRPIKELCERFVMMVKRYAPQSVEQMHELVQKSLAVGSVDEVNSPLVWSLERLYVRRYFTYENSIANYIKQVATTLPSKEQEQFLQQAVPLLFPEQAVLKKAYEESEDKDESLLVDWQKIAALMATTSNFTVISGGPGTGKTTTVLRMLLLLVGMSDPNLQISLCAPTGKAAARMGESILGQLQGAHIAKNIEQIAQLCHRAKEDIYAAIPYTAITVQALLKVRPNHATPILNADNKLDCDILVVDEVSMLDLALFYRLLEALKPQCKLILLGDKEQLSSVEAGSVLADLCARINSKDKQRLQEQTRNFLCRVSGYSEKQLLQGKIADHVSLLQFSYRSRDVKDIGRLAFLVNNAVSAVQEEQESSLGAGKGDIYAYCEAVNQEEIQVPDEDLKAQLSLFDGDDAVRADLDKIKQLFKDAKKQSSDTKKTGKSTEISKDAATAEKGTAKQDKQAKQAKSASGQSNFAAEIEAEINALWQPSKPAISHVLVKAQDVDKNKDKGETLARQLAQDAVSPERNDNYAPFLQKLAENDFKVSSDLKQREILFKLMDKFRILCSNHNGLLGDQALNRQICKEVQRTYLRGIGYSGGDDFFPGQIIIITKNDPVLGLVNGNVGFCAYDATEDEERDGLQGVKAKGAQDATANVWSQQEQKNALRVFIPVGVEERDGQSVTKVRVISTLLLTDYDNGFAMSIHKSQGSEYDKVTMVLSEKENRVLTKELVYTGITRAKKCVEVVSSDQVLLYAIGHSVVRESGLSQRLLQDQTESVAPVASAEPVVPAAPAAPSEPVEPTWTAPSSSAVSAPVAVTAATEPASASEEAKPKPKTRRSRATKATTEQAQASEAEATTAAVDATTSATSSTTKTKTTRTTRAKSKTKTE